MVDATAESSRTARDASPYQDCASAEHNSADTSSKASSNGSALTGTIRPFTPPVSSGALRATTGL